MALESCYFDSAGVALHFTTSGSGTPVVLLHGMFGNATHWEHGGIVALLIDANYRVIALDARGHGLSAKPDDPAAYGKEMALDVIRLLDHLGIDKAHMVGYSMGGNILVQLMAMHQERCLSVVLGGAAGRRNWSAADQLRCDTEASELEEGHTTSQVLRLAQGRPEGCPSEEEIKEHSRKVLEGNDHKAMAAVRRSNPQQVVTDRELSSVRVQVCGIVGTEDPYFALMQALQKEALPSMHLVAVEGATHGSCPTHLKFKEALLDFLGSQAAQL